MKYSLEEDRAHFKAQYLVPQAGSRAGGQAPAVLNCLIGEVPRYRPGDAESSAIDDRGMLVSLNVLSTFLECTQCVITAHIKDSMPAHYMNRTVTSHGFDRL